MDLEAKINADIKTAMLARDKRTLEALRAVKSEILLAKSEKGAEGAVGEEASIKILQRQVKQRKESAALYANQGRSDLEEEERFQLSIIQKYLPKQLSEEEVRGIIKRIITEAGAGSMKDMGRVMGMATRELSGRADNKKVAGIVKEMLS